VEGIVFVLGMHGEQLSHSVSAAYGSRFDGRAYLSRFINRRYTLKAARLDQLVRRVFSTLNLPANRLAYPAIMTDGGKPRNISPEEIITLYLRMYGVSARDVFTLCDSLETCLALTAPTPLELTYLLPLIVNYNRGLSGLPVPAVEPDWQFVFNRDHFGHDFDLFLPDKLAVQIQAACNLPTSRLRELSREDTAGWDVKIAATHFYSNIQANDLRQVTQYKRLVAAISEFKPPAD
jgi:hypothetical protein